MSIFNVAKNPGQMDLGATLVGTETIEMYQGSAGKRVTADMLAAHALVSATNSIWASVETTFVDGTDGTGAVQFVFKDAAGVQMAVPVAGRAYISEVATGLTMDILDDGLAVLTNGVIRLTTATVFDSFEFITTATGLLGLTPEGNADSYWVAFVHPTGKIVMSDEMAITG